MTPRYHSCYDKGRSTKELDLNQNEGDTMRSISGYTPKEKSDAEKVESCTREIARLENLLDAQKRILASAEKRLEQASKED